MLPSITRIGVNIACNVIVCPTVYTGEGLYPYVHHLLEFERRVGDAQVPAWLRRVATPLMWREWKEELVAHPDTEFRDYILNGITNGFRVGFNRAVTCRPATSNMRSALDNAAVVQEYLKREVSLGCIIGPISYEARVAGTQLSPFGVIPKSSQPGKWRLIVDLSSPENGSVNTGIEPELCSLHYLRLDEVLGAITQAGRGSQLAKMDIESAYRMIPVHPNDRPLLAVQWAGKIFYDTRLPFGLRSAPKIFTAVADALQWSFTRQGVTWVAHYLDDYITLGPPNSEVCGENLDRMLTTCRRLGVPVAPAKCAGPTSVLTFLGFELDTNCMVVRLPREKLQRTLALVREWMAKRACKKRELESLLGHLQHAATVIRAGRTFVRRLIELLAVFEKREHWVRLNDSMRSDLTWWLTYMEGWNGISVLPIAGAPTVPLVTDASGTWGCGAHWNTHWFQWEWEGRSREWHIAPKELLPILFALVVWGRQWVGRRVECQCDNMAVVVVINSGRSRDKVIMHLLRCMFFVVAQLDIQIHATHLPGVENIAADSLSRNRISDFLQVVPGADRLPATIPQPLIDMFVTEQPDWTSHRWAQLFSGCCRRV